jgi:hypothetical protein
MKREKKFKHARRPYWRIVWRLDVPYYQTSVARFPRFSLAVVDYMAFLPEVKRGSYLSMELQRVQPLVQGEPGWCSHNTEAMTTIMRKALVP